MVLPLNLYENLSQLMKHVLASDYKMGHDEWSLRIEMEFPVIKSHCV